VIKCESHVVEFVRDIGQGFEGGTREVISLKEADACILKPVVFAGRFNPFGYDINGQALADMLDAREHTLFDRILMDARDQLPVQLDKVRLVLDQQSQSGVTRAEVVDGRFESEILYDLQVLEQVAVIDQAFVFDDLEDDVSHRDAALQGSLERGCDAHIHFVHAGCGHVQVQLAGNLETAGEMNRLLTADLVEFGEVIPGDLCKHRSGRLAARTADKRLVGNNLPVVDIHNGLERKAEFKTKIARYVGWMVCSSEWAFHVISSCLWDRPDGLSNDMPTLQNPQTQFMGGLSPHI